MASPNPLPSSSMIPVEHYPSSLPTHGSWPLVTIVLTLVLLGAGTILLALRKIRSLPE